MSARSAGWNQTKTKSYIFGAIPGGDAARAVLQPEVRQPLLTRDRKSSDYGRNSLCMRNVKIQFDWFAHVVAPEFASVIGAVSALPASPV